MRLLLLVIALFGAFIGVVHQTPRDVRPTHVASGRVVLPWTVQVLLYGGDRYLAADLEAIRISTTSIEIGTVDVDYVLRAQREISVLNPCHEDVFYLSNAFLTWGGAEHYSGETLLRAGECRFWDEWPPFFYGFNQYFFAKNFDLAQKSLEVAAQRSKKNYAGFKRLAVMAKAESIDDERLAYAYLEEERNRAKDSSLRAALDKRLQRLGALIQLRDAARRYQEKFKRPLVNPQELIDFGLLSGFPQDPLNIGFEFENGKFSFRQIQVK